MRAFEDFTEGLEIPLGPYEVTREEEAAKTSMLGGLAASGWHTCAMMMRMMADAYVRDSTSQGSPGVDFVKWTRPVMPGDTLSGTARVLSARLSAKRPTIGIVRLRTTLRNGRGEIVLESEFAQFLLTWEGART